MKLNKWTFGLASAGLVSFCSTTQAEEAAHQLLTALSGTQISGFASASYINILGTGGMARQPHYTPGGGVTVPLADGFRLDVVGLQLQKAVDASEGFSAGYTVQALIGPDAVGYSDAVGLASDEFSVQAATVDLYAPVGNGLNISAGHFNTIVGYEVNNPAANGNYTRSYAFNAEPFTHTGVKADYALNDIVSVIAGVANTAAGINSISARTLNTTGRDFEGLTTMGALSVTLDDSAGALSGTSLYFAVVHGSNDPGVYGADSADQTHYYASVSVPTSAAGLDVGFSWDYREGTGYMSAYGLYAAFAPEGSEFSMNLRGEYASSNNGYFGLDGIDEDIYAITEIGRAHV